MYNIKEVKKCLIRKATISGNEKVEVNSFNISIDLKTLNNIFCIADKKIIDSTNNFLVIDTLDLDAFNIDLSQPTGFMFNLSLQVILDNGTIEFYEVKTPYYNFSAPNGLSNNFRNNKKFTNLTISVFADNINNFVINKVVD